MGEIARIIRSIPRPILAAVVAFVLFVPCSSLLGELAYIAYPSDSHEFGESVSNLFVPGYYRWDSLRYSLAVLAFFACFTFLQEMCLGRWPLRLRRPLPGTTAIVLLTAAVSTSWIVLAFVQDMSLVSHLNRIIRGMPLVFLFPAPWIAWAYLMRSLMSSAGRLRPRLLIYSGSVVAVIGANVACAAAFGDNDGTGQNVFGLAAAIPMVSILAGGVVDFLQHIPSHAKINSKNS